MKKILSIVLVLVIALSLSACNYDLFDTEYTFDYALVKMPDGTVQNIKIKTWTDYDGEQLQITDTDGTVYVVNSVNCVLVKESAKDE